MRQPITTCTHSSDGVELELLSAVIQYKERKSVGFEVLILACGHYSEGFSDPKYDPICMRQWTAKL